MNKVYYPEVSFIRAIACLLVVLTHTTLAYPVDQLDSSGMISLVINQLARVGTPIFALMSGLLLFLSVRYRPLDVKKFYKTRIEKIVTPYIFWSCIYLFLSHITHTHSFNPHDILKYLFLGESYAHLYFMIIVIQFYILFPMLTKVVTKHNSINWMIGTIILMAVWYIIRDDFSIPFISHRVFLLNWIGYFMMGCYIAYYIEHFQRYSIKQFSNYFTLILLSIIAMLIEMRLPELYRSDRLMNILFVPIFTIFFIGLYHYMKSEGIREILGYIGDRSMGIYLIHLLVIGVLGDILPSAFWQADYLWLNYILVIFFSLIAIEVIIWLPQGYKVLPIVKKERTLTQKNKESYAR